MAEREINAVAKIHEEATQAAKQAVQDYLENWRAKPENNNHDEPWYCGFAWVDVVVIRKNDPLAKALAAVGFDKSHLPKRMTLSNPAEYTGWSMDCKEVGAEAYAKVLQKHGIEAYPKSRPD